MTTQKEHKWATTQEFSFLRGLGKYRPDHTPKIARDVLLCGYIAGCEKRVRWGDIDKGAVMAYALHELEVEGVAR